MCPVSPGVVPEVSGVSGNSGKDSRGDRRSGKREG